MRIVLLPLILCIFFESRNLEFSVSQATVICEITRVESTIIKMMLDDFNQNMRLKNTVKVTNPYNIIIQVS